MLSTQRVYRMLFVLGATVFSVTLAAGAYQSVQGNGLRPGLAIQYSSGTEQQLRRAAIILSESSWNDELQVSTKVGSAEARMTSPDVMRQLELYRSALDQLRLAAQIDHRRRGYFWGLIADAAEHAKDTKTQINILQKMVGKHPSQTNCVRLAEALLAQQSVDIETVEQAIRLSKMTLGMHGRNLARAHNSLALGYHRLGYIKKSLPLYEQAAQHYQIALDVDPTMVHAQIRLREVSQVLQAQENR